MKRRIVIIIFVLSLFLTGCTHDMNKEEINELDLVLVLGIDYADGEYELSALYSTGEGGDSDSESGTGKEEVATGTGKTAYEALEKLKLKNQKDITLAQTSSFLIGEGAAKQGIDTCLDFLKRDETIKMEALIYIVKGDKASDFIQEAIENKQTIHADMKAVEQKQLKMLTRNDNTLVNILNDMEQSYSGILIPYLIADESSFLIEGYAVFDQLKLSDYLDRETSDGVNFFKNIMRTYPIYLKDGVALAISYTKTKLKAEAANNFITVTVKVDFDTMLKEITTKENVFSQASLLELTKQQNEYIRSVLEKPAQYSIDHALDILSLARLVENQNTREWGKLKDTWKESIPKIRYEYIVRSQITKSFILGKEENNVEY